MSSKARRIHQCYQLSSQTDLIWGNTIELVGFALEITPNTTYSLNPQYTAGLHAWFLDRVRQTNPALSQVLHDEQEEKAFTISNLDGKLLAPGKDFQLQAQQTYLWTITALSSPVAQWLAAWVEQLPKAIQLRSAVLPISGSRIVHAPTTYRQIWEKAQKAKSSLKLSFLTPTSFRRQGHHFPLPVPTNLFQSYLRRWNIFSGMPFEQNSFLEWVDKSVIIVRHTLSSCKVQAGKRGAVTGFTGAVEFSLSKSAYQQPEFVQLFYSLGLLVPYCGTGHKTTFGLGQTRLGWLLEEMQSGWSMQSLMAQRIEELTEIFLSLRKRKGGARALNIAQTLAIVLARREVGESLLGIAADLDMPYETVKTYVKKARQELKVGKVL